MARYIIKMSDFNKASPEEQDEIMREMMRRMNNPTQEEIMECISDLAAELKVYEDKYGFPSSQLHEKLDTGEIRETHDICCWLMDLSKWERYKEVCPNEIANFNSQAPEK